QVRLHDGAPRAALDVAEQAFELQQTPHGGAQDRKTLEENRPQVDLDPMPGGGAAEDDSPAARQRLDAFLEHLAADVIDDDVDAGAAGQLAHSAREVLFGVIDDVGRAER